MDHERKVLWTPEKDALLLAERAKSPPRGWRWLSLALMCTQKECEGRHKLLTGETQPVRVGRKAPAEIDRDGLSWLIRKGRLTGSRAKMALAYRAAFRDAGMVSLKSCLGDSVGGGAPGPGTHADFGVTSATDASRRLFFWRWVVLRGQSDMVLAVEGICGTGHSPRDLAGGNGHRAAELETVLGIALDLMVDEEAKTQKKAA